MYNAVTAYNSLLEGECTCEQDVARFLVEIVELQGRVVKSYGRICFTLWMMLDDGLLLFTGPRSFYGAYEETTAHLVWVPDLACVESPSIQDCLALISHAKEGSIIDEYKCSLMRIEVGLQIERLVFLRNDAGLHAYPPPEVNPGDSLDGFRSKGMKAFGLVFSQSETTGYLSLLNFHLFLQGPDWRYSGHPWFKTEPRLAMQPYGYWVLFVSQDNAKVLSIDGSEQRYCLFFDEMHWSREFRAIEALFHKTFDAYDWENAPYYNSREALEPFLEVWRVILSCSDWKSLYEQLCKDTYTTLTEYTSWPKFCKEYEQANYLEMREALQYLYDWVSVALDAAGGVYAYYLWLD